MRASLTALTEELRRLKASGVREVSVPPETVERLRTALAKRKTAKPAPAPTRVTRVGEPSETTVAIDRTPAPFVTPETPQVNYAPEPEPMRKPKPTVFAEARFTLPAEGTKTERLAALREIVLADETCNNN